MPKKINNILIFSLILVMYIFIFIIILYYYDLDNVNNDNVNVNVNNDNVNVYNDNVNVNNDNIECNKQSSVIALNNLEIIRPKKFPYDIVIITIKRAIDRQEHIYKTMEYPFELYYGVDGKMLSNEELNKHSIPGKISVSQVGIFLSHLTLWRKLRNKKIPTLIMEDDSFISGDLNIIDISPVLDNFDIIYYGSCYNKPGIQVNKHLYTSVKPIGMHGYLISQRGVNKLLDFFENYKITLDFDNILVEKLINTGILTTYSVFPPIINQKNEDLPTISDRFFSVQH